MPEDYTPPTEAELAEMERRVAVSSRVGGPEDDLRRVIRALREARAEIEHGHQQANNWNDRQALLEEHCSTRDEQIINLRRKLIGQSDRIAALEADKRRLVEVLRPFANNEWADQTNPTDPLEVSLCVMSECHFRAADLARVDAVLAAIDSAGKEHE